MEERARRYLFEEHSPAQLRAWTLRLRYFRFCRAVGGHAGDGDTLRLHLRAHSLDDALGVLAALGVAEPGWVTIDDTPLYISIHRDRVELTVQDPDDVWAVTEAAVRGAERLEPRLAPYERRRIDPPVDSWHCIAPATHPELFD